ncbi:MAG: lysophospholipid acyltransferase family protein [Bacillota bacterium]|jgi:1-acyl-sn-glycerol-3-phosphate acyltransferase
MSDLLRYAASAWTWLVLITCMVILFPVMILLRLVTAPFDPGRYIVGRVFRYIGVIVERLNPLWRLRLSGVQIENPRHPYVVVSNHESFADILLISNLPWEMKWLSKAELFRIPLLGWMMRLAGDVPIRRGFGPSAVEAIEQCRQILRNHVSVMIFPEGTRSTTGRMLPFKDGAFRLAVEAGVPVLPLVVAGSGTALPKRGWKMGRSDAEVRVLEPVPTEGLTANDVAGLRNRVRKMIEDARATMGAAAP